MSLDYRRNVRVCRSANMMFAALDYLFELVSCLQSSVDSPTDDESALFDLVRTRRTVRMTAVLKPRCVLL